MSKKSSFKERLASIKEAHRHRIRPGGHTRFVPACVEDDIAWLLSICDYVVSEQAEEEFDE